MAVTQPATPQQMLMALFADEVSTLVWSTDADLQVDQLAGGVLSTLGIDEQEFVEGLLVEAVFEQEEDPETSLIAAHRSALTGEFTSCQFQWRGWHFRGRVSPQVDDCGAIIGCLGVACLHAAIDGLEEALDASERRFETLVGMSPAGIYMTDEAGRCTYVNQRWCQMAGVSAVDALGHSWEQVIHPDDRVRVATHWRRAMGSGAVWEHAYRLLSPQGTMTWVLGQARPLHGANVQVTGYVGIMIDITERKTADRRLRESEKRFASLLSAVTSYRYCVLLSNGAPVTTEHSTSCVGTTGYSPEDYAQDPYLWINMVHPEDRQLVRDHVGKVLNGQPVPSIEHRIYHKNGSVVWVRDTIIPHHASDGELIRYDGLVEDITDRKRVDRRLWQILESAPDAMVITDQRGTILLANGQTHRLFGYASQELVNQPVEILIPERFRTAHVAHRTAYAGAPDLRVMTERPELFGRRKDGSEFAAEISLSPIEMDDEVLVCAGIRDISHRKLAEERLRYREAQLIAAQKIQEHLLPRHSPNLLGYDIAGRVVPAQFAGGDHFDYLPLANGTMAIIVGDVSGHDVSAALVMASTSAHLRSFAEDHTCVQEIVEHTNSILERETDDGCFVTLFVLQLDSAQRTIRFVNAGHPHGYVLRADGQLKATLGSTSFPLAVLPDAEYPVSDPLALESGDLVLLITDGILEARCPDGTCFDSRKLLDVAREHRHRPAAAIIDAIQQTVLQFTGLPHTQDDLTTVIIKVQ